MHESSVLVCDTYDTEVSYTAIIRKIKSTYLQKNTMSIMGHTL